MADMIMKSKALLIICLTMAMSGGVFYYYWKARTSTPVKQQGLVVMNVLEPEVYQDCHIPKSINVTLDMLSAEWCQNNVSQDAEIVVYCSDYRCATSEYVAKKLKEFGFPKVAVYEGGMAEWYQENFPVVGPCKLPYLTHKVEKPLHNSTEVDTILLQTLADKMNITRKTAV